MKDNKAVAAPAPRGRESGGGNPRKRSRDSSTGHVDLISNLPDAILGTIISLLPTKDGARTQALARRWRSLWRTAPLNLNASYDLCRDASDRFSVVSKILSDHHGPARRFCFRAIPLHEAKKRFPEAAQAQVDAWFHSRALAGLQELDVGFDLLDSTSPGNERRHPLPPSMFRCGSTLVEARIGSCDFPKAISPPYLSFPLLKKLSLNSLSISADVFHGLLSACHALESLYLQEIIRGDDDVGCLRISSPTIRTVGICACFPGNSSGEIIIEDAPRFQRLLLPSPGEGGETIRVTCRAPNLEILGPLSPHISEIQIHNLIFQSLAATSLTSTISTVKVLALELSVPDLNHVIHVLRCFPCLEKLHVIRNKSLQVVRVKENARHYDPLLDPVKCLDTHLKELELANYEGTEQDVVSFAKFFILNAKLLKLIKFELNGKVNKEWVADQLLVLPETGSRASPCVQLEFGADVCSYCNPFWYL